MHLRFEFLLPERRASPFARIDVRNERSTDDPHRLRIRRSYDGLFGYRTRLDQAWRGMIQYACDPEGSKTDRKSSRN
jgi:hypothetical protein